MSRLDSYLHQLQEQRRSRSVTQELFEEWKQDPMTQIFFLDLDIKLIEQMRISSDSGAMTGTMDSNYAAYNNGQSDSMKEMLDYEPHELANKVVQDDD